jgi:DHA2 family multidrug resistance protein
MLVTGALLIATTQILPQALHEEFGYTATLAGLAISPSEPAVEAVDTVCGQRNARCIWATPPLNHCSRGFRHCLS